ncbi:MAG: DUF389 domain-containing protein [Alphaproteobacteria bacterium]|nr:DUF389 domain-containing protein [Alphaproteobacteria bacterium]
MPEPTTHGFRTWPLFEREPPHDKAETRRIVSAGAVLSPSYLAMNAAATLIAGYGLLADSVAVIIGAMLIAMLYGPILGISLALAEANNRLLARALVAEAVGVLWVLMIGAALGRFHLDVPIGEQILSRTAPNLLDLMIALVGGAAGGYAAVSSRVSGAVTGVAIATALCPPLTACGILLAHGLPNLAGGAFLLFLANFTAICIGAMVVLLLSGHHAIFARPGGRSAWIARIVPVALLAVMGPHLVGSLHSSVEDATLRSSVERALHDGLAGYPSARVVEVRLARERLETVAFAVVRAPAPLGQTDVARLDDAVDRATGRDISLHVRMILVEELTRDGAIFVATPSTVRARVGR